MPYRFISFALGTWLGAEALRSYIAFAVWNVGDVLPVALKGVPPALIFLAGLLPARRWAGRHARRNLALAFAVVTVLRQLTISSDAAGTACAFAAWLLWLWWLPAAFEDAGDDARSIPAAVFAGAALLVSVQTALHGLTLGVDAGVTAVAIAVVGAAAFAAANFAAAPHGEVPAWDGDALQRAEEQRNAVAWGAVAFGPLFFLLLTLFAVPGRIEQATGWDTGANVYVVAALLAAAAFATLPTWRRARLAVAALLLVVTGAAAASSAIALSVFMPALWACAFLFSGAFAPRVRGLSIGRGFVLGAVLFFVMLFSFYTLYELHALWVVAAAVVAIVGLGGARTQRAALRPVLACAVLSTVAIAAGVLPGRARAAEPALPGPVRVLSYNVHQGFDVTGVPAHERIAQAIEHESPDLVGLQEVNRGWDMLGGADLIAWLRWRFPDYYVAYGPSTQLMWGNAVMSRFRPVSSGGSPFATQASRFHYGFAWVRIDTRRGDLLFASAHLAPGLLGGTLETRAAQAGELFGLWSERPRAVVAGDFNSEPTDPAIQQALEAGMRDVAATSRGGTYPSDDPRVRIDYIFTTADLALRAAWIPVSAASDHRAVAASLVVE